MKIKKTALPYKFTICPPNEPPKQYTAMTQQMVNALRHGNDLTIDQRAYVYPVHSSNFEGKLAEVLTTRKANKNEDQTN